MIKFYCVRHGETAWNKQGKFQGHANVDLNEKGKIQADLAGKYMGKIKIDEIFSSPLKRAFSTAKQISKYQKKDVQKDDRLIEINFGDWEGLSPKIIKMKWPGRFEEMFSNPDEVRIPNGESFKCVAKRTKSFLDELVKKGDGKTYLIVSHGIALRTIYCNLLDISLKKAWNISQKNASISCIEYYNKNKSVLSFLNLTEHLKK